MQVFSEISPAVWGALAEDQRARVRRLSCWSLDDVRTRVMRRLGWSDSLADEAVREYRKFLTLILLGPDEDYGISAVVDEVWHQHILDTMDYTEMCARVFGAMVHHRPAGLSGDVDLEPYRRRTTQNLSRVFSGPVNKLWSNEAHGLAKCCSHIRSQEMLTFSASAAQG